MSTNWRTLVQRSINTIITNNEIALVMLYRKILESHGKYKNTRRLTWVPEPYAINESLELRDQIITDIRKIIHPFLSEDLCYQIWTSLKNRVALMDEIYVKLFLFFGVAPEAEFTKLTFIYGYKSIAMQNVDKSKQQQYENEVIAKNPWIKQSLSLLLSQKNCAEDILTNILIQYIGPKRSNHFPVIRTRILHFAVIFNLPKVVAHLFTIALSDDKSAMLDDALQHLFVPANFTKERYQVYSHIWEQCDHHWKIQFLLKNNLERVIAANFDFMFTFLNSCTPEEIQNFLRIKAPQELQTGYCFYREAVSFQCYNIAEIIFDLYTTQWQYFAIRYSLQEAIKFANINNVQYLGNLAKDKLSEMVNYLLNIIFIGDFRNALLSIDNQTIPILDINEFVRLEEQLTRNKDGQRHYMSMITYFYQQIGKNILTSSDCFLFRLAMNKRSFSGVEYMMNIAEPNVQTIFLNILGIDRKAWLSLVEKVHNKIKARADSRQQFAEGIAELDKYIRATQQPKLFREKLKCIEEITKYFISAYISDKDIFHESIQNLRAKLFMYSKEFVVNLKNIISDVDPHHTSYTFNQSAIEIKRVLTSLR